MIFIRRSIMHRSYFTAISTARCICSVAGKSSVDSNFLLRVLPKYDRCLLTTGRCVYSGNCSFSQSNGKENKSDPTPPPEKLGIVARFKQMYRDYWYVLLPVHILTSSIWYGSFYFLAKGGVDIVQLLTWMGISDTLIEPLKSSSAGYFAIAYALYKIATPLRYTVTIGGTTLTINYLRDRGYLKPKPIPSPNKLKEMYEDTRQELVQKRNQIMEKKDNIKEEFKRYQSKVQDGDDKRKSN